MLKRNLSASNRKQIEWRLLMDINKALLSGNSIGTEKSCSTLKVASTNDFFGCLEDGEIVRVSFIGKKMNGHSDGKSDRVHNGERISVLILSEDLNKYLHETEFLRSSKEDTEPNEPLRKARLDQSSDHDGETKRAIDDFIREHISNPELNVCFISQKMNLSRSKIYSLFKSSESVERHIYARRVEEFQYALTRKAYTSITNIIIGCGFKSESHCRRLFKITYGMSVTEFVGYLKCLTRKPCRGQNSIRGPSLILSALDYRHRTRDTGNVTHRYRSTDFRNAR